MEKLKEVIKEHKIIVASYQEDGGLYDDIKYYQEHHNDFRNDFEIEKELDEIDDDFINKYLCNMAENDYYDFHYENFVYNMKDALKDIGKGVWVIECKNANWRGQTGIMESEDPEKVIDAILMHDGQCNTEVWEGEDGDKLSSLEGVCYHHDCPTGSWFTITGNHE
jgi:hypothetical protein